MNIDESFDTGTNGKNTSYDWGSDNDSTIQHWLLVLYSAGNGSYNFISKVLSPALDVSNCKLLAIIVLLPPKFKAKSTKYPDKFL